MINSFLLSGQFGQLLEMGLLLEDHTLLVHITYLWTPARGDADFALRSISTFDVLFSFWLNYRSCPGIRQPIFIEHQSRAQHRVRYRCG